MSVAFFIALSGHITRCPLICDRYLPNLLFHPFYTINIYDLTFTFQPYQHFELTQQNFEEREDKDDGEPGFQQDSAPPHTANVIMV